MPAKKKAKKSGKKPVDLTSRALTTKQARGVRGGKHIAGVKYEDITVNCGTGMSKIS
jgi:hypothetical protein